MLLGLGKLQSGTCPRRKYRVADTEQHRVQDHWSLGPVGLDVGSTRGLYKGLYKGFDKWLYAELERLLWGQSSFGFIIPDLYMAVGQAVGQLLGAAWHLSSCQNAQSTLAASRAQLLRGVHAKISDAQGIGCRTLSHLLIPSDLHTSRSSCRAVNLSGQTLQT